MQSKIKILHKNRCLPTLKTVLPTIKSLDSCRKIEARKSLPTQKLVNRKWNIPQPRINPEFQPKISKADESVKIC